MNGEQAERFQQLLEEACDHFIEYDGGRIVDRAFSDSKTGQCPLTCLFGKVLPEKMVVQTNSLLGIDIMTVGDIWAFINAFDGNITMEYHKPYVSAILIGRALREKYIGVST